ncbi:hypothetical protein ACFFX1_39460 [Dactylosporangium sucinum]|uniref:Uncharacterized protein n=1 Tax=Dactylosporangium sucinum TaxID=1424081 RepID=A0A917SZ67_9ACTN|nr:hypothetical protein [Dactylosporangium sucinum]GGM03127.1 hypothetical protein GCM10007977_000630 [Dactylosporangium sucinum]
MSALDDLRRRLDDFARTGDPAGVLGDEATVAAYEIVEGVRAGTLPDPLPALALAGQLYWRRHLTTSADKVGLGAAAVLLARPYAADRRLVPEPLWPLLRTLDTGLLLELSLVESDPETLSLRAAAATDFSEAARALAINALETALAMLPRAHEARPALQVRLAVALLLGGEDGHATELAAGAAPALAARPGGVDPFLLSQAGQFMLRRHEQDEDPATLDAAVTLSRLAVDGIAPDNPFLAGARHNLGIALISRYAAGGDPRDRSAALDAARAAVAVSDPDYPTFPLHAWGLVQALTVAYDDTGDPALLDEAGAVFARAEGRDGGPYGPLVSRAAEAIAKRRAVSA